MATVTRSSSGAKAENLVIQRNYNEIIELLEAKWQHPVQTSSLSTMKKLYEALNAPAKKMKVVVVQGTNGKSLTINFSKKLLLEENIKVGAFYTPHLLNYNERLMLGNESISNKMFVEIANEVINTAHTHAIKVSSFELLLGMALVFFEKNNVEVAFLESQSMAPYDASLVVDPFIFVVTRMTDQNIDPKNPEMIQNIQTIMQAVQPGSYVVSGDQSKLNLQTMAQETHQRKGIWEMPIRKLVVLQYPYEQLHGRCAALAERICNILTQDFNKETSSQLATSLLIKQKSQRGRPTLEAKRIAELNPQRTLEQFWKEESTSLSGRFQIIKEKPTVLLDTASNIDAFDNLLLGIRLLHYQKPLKGLAIIIACDKKEMDGQELLRLLRYFTKKNSAHIIFCSLQSESHSFFEDSWNVDELASNIISLKIKVKTAENFSKAFEIAKALVDERNGLVVVTGSQSIVSSYWKHKGLKNVALPR